MRTVISITAVFAAFLSFVNSDLVIEEKTISVLVGGNGTFNILLTAPLNQTLTVTVSVFEKGVLILDPSEIHVPANSTGSWPVTVYGVDGGHVLVTAASHPNITRDDNAFIHVTVEFSQTLTLISKIIGWIYFAAWTASFYPQIYDNFERKSVIGLSFDYLALNIVGFTLYAIFNCGLYWVHVIEDEYFRRHPRGLNPVQLNDIVFAVHAAIVTGINIVQCFFYERGKQKVSNTVWLILGAFSFILAVCFCLVLLNYMTWLDFFYDCSYVKLTITLIKYIPQAVFNYRRKSTKGWSIGNILLDFTGGSLSIGQMLINAYNYSDWVSIFGDPTKFGLGMFSMMFDMLFIVQHYILYRHRSTEDAVNTTKA